MHFLGSCCITYNILSKIYRMPVLQECTSVPNVWAWLFSTDLSLFLWWQSGKNNSLGSLWLKLMGRCSNLLNTMTHWLMAQLAHLLNINSWFRPQSFCQLFTVLLKSEYHFSEKADYALGVRLKGLFYFY
jgi:hypothetical protein